MVKIIDRILQTKKPMRHRKLTSGVHRYHPATGDVPSADGAEWLTQQGEPFEYEGPQNLGYGASCPISCGTDALSFRHRLMWTQTYPSRLVDLLFDLSVVAGADVRLLNRHYQSARIVDATGR